MSTAMPSEHGCPHPQRSRLARLLGFLDQDPDNPNLLAEVADLALALGELETARNAIEQGLNLWPADPFFTLRLASAALAAGNAAEALALTGRVLEQGIIDPAVRFNHAFALISLGEYAQAKSYLAALVAEQAPYPLLVPLLMRAHHYLGEVEPAIAVARGHLDTHPEDATVAGMLSLLYFDADDLEQARVWSTRALERAPANGDALLAAAGVSLAAEDAATAKALLHRAVSVEPRNGRIWASLGLAHLLEFNLPAARDQLEQAVKYMPGHLGTWIALGWAQLLQNDLAGAEASFNSALAIDDTFAEAHGGLAAVAAMKGDWARADERAKVARRLDPKSMSASYGQVVRLQREGQGDAALRLIQEALRRGSAPAGGSLLDMVARIGRQQGK